jgi:hypothetical protein
VAHPDDRHCHREIVDLAPTVARNILDACITYRGLASCGVSLQALRYHQRRAPAAVKRVTSFCDPNLRLSSLARQIDDVCIWMAAWTSHTLQQRRTAVGNATNKDGAFACTRTGPVSVDTVIHTCAAKQQQQKVRCRCHIMPGCNPLLHLACAIVSLSVHFSLLPRPDHLFAPTAVTTLSSTRHCNACVTVTAPPPMPRPLHVH